MFLTTTHYANKCCVGRRLFTTQKEADSYAREAVKERVHRIDNLTFMGKVSIVMWNISKPTHSNHVDKPVATYHD